MGPIPNTSTQPAVPPKNPHSAAPSQQTLIAGGAGYIGQVLCRRLLEEGHLITVLDSFIHGPQEEGLKALRAHPNFTLIEGDIRDLSLAANLSESCQNVILLAALVGEPACDKDPQSALETNYLAALSFFQAARFWAGNKRFVFASTDSCYGTREGEMLDEKAALRPISLYARLKAQAEEEMLSFKPKEGFCPIVLRMATVYGLSPRMRFDLAVNVLTREAVVNKRFRIFSGEQWRPLVHVGDAAKAFALVLNAPEEKVKNQVFNVGSNSQNVQFRTLGQIISREVPGAVMEIVDQTPDLRDYHVSFDKIASVLGFSPDYQIDRGVRELRDALEGGLFEDPFQARYRNS